MFLLSLSTFNILKELNPYANNISEQLLDKFLSYEAKEYFIDLKKKKPYLDNDAIIKEMIISTFGLENADDILIDKYIKSFTPIIKQNINI